MLRSSKLACRALLALLGGGLIAATLAVPAAAAPPDVPPPASQAAPAQEAPATVAPKSAQAPSATVTVPSGLAAPANTTAPPAPRPGLDPTAYAAAKAAAARAPVTTKPVGPGPLAPPTIQTNNFNGTNQATACNCEPPDTHGTVGTGHYVQIVNSRVVMYNKSTNAIVKQVSLNSFFGYTGPESNLLFDPRAVYDPTWNRYVLIAEGRPEADNEQYFFIGVSQTGDPTGAFFIYKLLINNTPGVFFDYPQLGFDNGAVIVTANVFPSSLGTPYFFKKSALYNGLGFTYWFFSGLAGTTLAPSIVLDANPTTFMTAAPPSGSAIRKLGFKDTDRDPPALTQNVNIPVAAYSVPPDARQPGTAVRLDSLDSRFVNAGTQFGDRLFQTHTVALGSFPAPKFYEFNTTSNTVVQTGFYFASSTSDDWNASIAANPSREVFVTYSSTDTTTRAQMRISGKQPADLGIPAGTATVTSPSIYTIGTPHRWGDYSSVSLDPSPSGSCAANRRAWGTNEQIVATNSWGTRITRFGFC